MPDDFEYRIHRSYKKFVYFSKDWATSEPAEDEESSEGMPRAKYRIACSHAEQNRKWFLTVHQSAGQFEPVNREPWNDCHVPKPDSDWQPWGFFVNEVHDSWGQYDGGYAPDEQTAMMNAIKACDAMESYLIGIPWEPSVEYLS